MDDKKNLFDEVFDEETANTPPVNSKTSKSNKVLKIVLAVIIALFVFFAGFFTYSLTISSDLKALNWALGMLEKHNYMGLTRDELVNSAGSGMTTHAIDQYSDFFTPDELGEYMAGNTGNRNNFGISFAYGQVKGQEEDSGIYVGKSNPANDIPIMAKILNVDGRKYIDNDSLITYLKSVAAGKDIVIKYSVLNSESTKTIKKNSEDGDALGFSFIQGEINNSAPIKGVFIMRVAGNSPAYDAGIEVMDKFYMIDGINVENSELERISELLSSGDTHTVRFKHLVNNNGIIEQVEYPSSITVTRGAYSQKYTQYIDNTTKGISAGLSAKTHYGDMNLPNNTAYISFSNFLGGCAAEFKSCFDTYRKNGNRNLILDMRNNGGGDLSLLVDIAGHFVREQSKRELVIEARDKKGNSDKYNSNVQRDSQNNVFDKIVVLVDGGTASASEALLGFLMDYFGFEYNNANNKLQIVGTDTYGKDIIQTTFFMSGTNYAVKMTTHRYFTPSGDTINSRADSIKGIRPNVIVKNNDYNLPYKYVNDTQLQTAISLI